MKTSFKYSYHQKSMIFPPIESFYISTSTFKIIVENITAIRSCSSSYVSLCKVVHSQIEGSPVLGACENYLACPAYEL